MKKISKSISIIILFMGIFAVSFTSCKSETKDLSNDKIYTESSDNSDQQNISNSRQNAITRAVKICSPAIVGISVTEVVEVAYRDPYREFMNDPFFRNFFGNDNSYHGYTQKYQVQGLGSGYIISPDGYILTNHHVAGNASKVIITMKGGKKYDAEIIGADKTADVALLKIDGTDFPYLKLGNSDETIIGEWVIAFGNPFGLFDLNAKPTVTVGVISNTGVNFTQEGRVYKNMIQTDAAISSGNSGGPLINSNGEVIGMNTVIFSTAQNGSGAGSIGIGFAIPVNRVKEVTEKLKKNKKIDRNYYVGMDVREIDDQISRYLKLDDTEGVVILQIERNSPADIAGLEPGDVIQEIDGNKIRRKDDYVLYMSDYTVDEKVKLLIKRNNKELSKTILLKPRKQR